MKTWALARFTVKEAVRGKAMIAGLVISLLYLALVPAFSSPSGGNAIVGDEQMRIAASREFLNFALGGLNFIGMFLAIFTTLGTIYSEIERGTIVTLVTKPISRVQLIAGKWLGHVMLMAAYVIIMGLALWLSVALGSGMLVWRFFPALMLVCLNVITMVSLTLAFSTVLPVVANAVFVFLMMVITSNLRIVHAIGETSQNAVIMVAANLFRMVLPVGEVNDLAGRIMLGQTQASNLMGVSPSAFTPRAWSFLYELVYLSALLMIAVLLFQKKDLS
ncbi:MAG: ABC transporter permease subunit [Thermoleophilia bacterium]|nr:ABC transporter permease subunit [Thermoleophilia bacterium]